MNPLDVSVCNHFLYHPNSEFDAIVFNLLIVMLEAEPS